MDTANARTAGHPGKRFEELFAILQQRKIERPPGSSTVEELDKGPRFIGKKVLEEAAEVWMASEHETPERVAEEISQVLYHLQVMMLAHNLTLEDVYRFL